MAFIKFKFDGYNFFGYNNFFENLVDLFKHQDENFDNLNYIDDVPWEIIWIIFEFLDFKSRIDFTSTCKIFRRLVKFHNFQIKIPISYYGVMLTNKLYFFRDVLINFSNIKELILITTQNRFCIYNRNFEFPIGDRSNWLNPFFDEKQICQFPNLKKIKLVSNFYIFLNKWKMPNLTHLDVTHCINCVLDDCNFPMLTHLYIRSDFKLPLRFCNVPNDVIVVIIKNEFIDKKINIRDFINITNDKVDSCPYIDQGDYILCNSCLGICDIIEPQARCRDCGKHRQLDVQELRKLHKYPCCIQGHSLSIYMSKSGYGHGYCIYCDKDHVLTRFHMYAASKLRGSDKYPKD